jgi:hypothetical protein
MRAVFFAVGAVSAVVTLSSPLAAQSRGREWSPYLLDRAIVPPAPSQSRISSTNQAVDGRYMPLADTSGGMSATKRGALWGAGIGLAAGLVGGIWLSEGIGCISPVEGGSPGCSTSRRAAGAIVLTSATGTGIGALIGAGVGSLVHALRSATSKPY